ncbi:hypothetical protein FRB95_014466 [Tulasnella sp. JGI-2019a]|nr:hypothetical protein FRB93_006990 [Tulasnella sp. JGI-2019a]KAG9033677.1 hypothetical protein FRB95_014466 [Tulasnella sp. JGI-2019a]
MMPTNNVPVMMSSHNLPTELFDYTKSNPAFAMDRITALTLFPNNGYFVAYGATWGEPIEGLSPSR